MITIRHSSGIKGVIGVDGAKSKLSQNLRS